MYRLNKHSALMVLCALLMLLSFTACQKESEKQVSSAGKSDSAVDSPQVNPRVSELLSAMDIFQFSETVKAPEFELKDLKGRTVNVAQFQGKVIVLSFWATW
jgi:ABC-type Fe3+-hydroxamate transport system substrate-binding protein